MAPGRRVPKEGGAVLGGLKGRGAALEGLDGRGAVLGRIEGGGATQASSAYLILFFFVFVFFKWKKMCYFVLAEQSTHIYIQDPGDLGLKAIRLRS